MKRSISIIALTFVAISLLAGCATNSSSDFTSRDTDFAMMMIPHHQQAIEMSDLALKNSKNSEVIALAEEIKKAQGPEIELMSSWPGLDAGTHAGHIMEGMLDDSEMEALRGATGIEFDRLFLEGMIKHHEGAISMAQDVVDSMNKEVADLANSIVESQTSEIERMKVLLVKLG